jgi:invasion protein IalB
MTALKFQPFAASLVAATIAFGGLAGGAAAQITQRANPPPAAPPSRPQLTAPAPAQAQSVPPAADSSSAPVRIETIVHDTWTLTCRDLADRPGKKACSAEMRVADNNNKQVTLMAWVIGRDQQGILRTVLQTPTGVQIAKGVELKLGSSPKPITLQYATCDAQRCESSIEVDSEFMRAANAANASSAVVTIVLSDGRGINFNIAIKGIDKVLAAMAATR